MSKGNNRRGNRETKKPKKIIEKVAATAEFTRGKTAVNFGERKKNRLELSKKSAIQQAK